MKLIIDSFAGGGGASTGIFQATGRHPDYAINHDPKALEMHKANHPETEHLVQDIWDVDPATLVAGREVELLWASPDCKHFSRAKGSKPVEKNIRGLAWNTIQWAKDTRPEKIFLENVPEFQDWGPLTADGRPDKSRKGETFAQWVAALQELGYEVQWRVLRACDFGAPTTRKRLYVIARCDGKPIVWPVATHGADLEPHVPASECIDWSIPGRSIFGRKRPLAEASMFRIARGMKKYVFEGGDDAFLIRTGHYSNKTGAGRTMRGQRLDAPLGTVCALGNDKALIVPWIAQYFGGQTGKPVNVPLPTVTSVDHHALVSTFITKFYGTSTGQSVNAPMPTVTAGGNHIGLVRAFLSEYFGEDHNGLVSVHGRDYQVTDITLRMLEPHELAAAQGFPKDYVLLGTKSNKIAKIGNSVVPIMAKVLVGANS